MDEISKGYRDAEQDTREGLRGADIPAPREEAGNIGDNLGHDLGNLGDDVGGVADRTFPDTPVSDNTM